ncbi:hypothetical protein SO802_015360 [Lithocarpus litseifolius]|uniref:CCHC-type domain-containing protein n=1 Tax=Lithocarpus litseifolius TaxID=425828 RepID=A0AAW2CUR9_9ROSI
MGSAYRLQIIEVGSNLFQFKFQSEFEMYRVLRGGPWTFDNQLLMLKKWHKGMTAGNVKLEHASVWVQIWGAPFDMISPQVATEVGKRLGVVEEVERRKVRDIQNFFMRVRVALPISKPLRRGSYIADSSGERTWVNFKYKRLPIFCFFCGLLGHDVRHCAKHFAVEKNGGEADFQYGEWLKAFGGRSRSPPRSPPRDGGAEDVQSSDAWELRRPASQGMDKHQHLDKPEVYEEKIDTQGPWIQQSVAVILGVIEGENIANTSPIIMEKNMVNSRVDLMPRQDMFPVNEPSELEPISEYEQCVGINEGEIHDNVENINVDSKARLVAKESNTFVSGPSEMQPTKLKSTWTRIMRMDYGLGGLPGVSEIPLLGKRGKSCEAECTSKQDVESVQHAKRGKLRWRRSLVQAWFIWNQRNAILHGGQMRDSKSLNQRAVEYLDEFQNVQTHINFTHTKPQNRQKWKPPVSQLYKLNFDAAVFAGTQSSRFGVVIRNSASELMAAMSVKGPSVSCSEEAEALACRKALEFAVESGFTEIIIEGDNVAVMKAVAGTSGDFSLLGHVYANIKCSIRGLQYADISCIKRGGNQVAHILAKYARNVDHELYWIEDTPPPVIEALY